jgi:hypothetical protein
VTESVAAGAFLPGAATGEEAPELVSSAGWCGAAGLHVASSGSLKGEVVMSAGSCPGAGADPDEDCTSGSA